MFIQTEDTPNPLSMKFIADRAVLGQDASGRPALGRDFPNAATAAASPLAMTLFDIDGVSGVFLGHDFVKIGRAHV